MYPGGNQLVSSQGLAWLFPAGLSHLFSNQRASEGGTVKLTHQVLVFNTLTKGVL